MLEKSGKIQGKLREKSGRVKNKVKVKYKSQRKVKGIQENFIEK
jgi:hypothetical protein